MSSVLVSLLALVATSPPAAAAPKPISGKLSQPGYTVIALSTGTKARAFRTRRGKFALRPPAKRVTLHLRDPNGIYAGPIVLASRARGRLAVLGVRPGARLGRITVKQALGYARVARRPRRRAIDTDLLARARKGAPIGAGNFGRVRSKPPRDRVPGDLDYDGIPNRLDIDDDGDLILDKVDRSRRARAAQSPGHQDPFDLASSLGGVPLERTANVNAGSSDAQIATVLPDFGFLSMAVPQADSVELDCGGTPNPAPPPPLVGGLSYCSYGGTGRVELPPPRNVFPECCDPDGNGYGTLEPKDVGPDFVVFHIDHGANSSQIGTGDTLILRLTNGGQQTQLTDTQQFIFATTPALVSYVDEIGKRTVVPYPVPPGGPGTFDPGPGTSGNGFPVVDGPDADSDAEVTVTLWRPQRRPTSEQECAQPPAPDCTQHEWIDVGGLDYTAGSREGQLRTRDAGWCRQSDFATSDPNLSPGFPDPQGGGFRDLAPSRPPNAANTFTYKLNLTKCLKAFGLGFAPGQTQTFGFQAFTPIQGEGSAGVDDASTQVAFTRR